MLDDELHVPVHRTAVNAECLKYSYDIDGIVIELSEIGGVVVELNYMSLPELRGNILQNHFHYLKKHIKLSQCSDLVVRALHNCCGWSVSQIDGEYFLNLTVLPTQSLPVNSMFTCGEYVKVKSAEILNRVIENLRLKELCPCNMARPTIAKTDFGNLACMNVLLPDQGFVFMLLEQSLKGIDAGSNVTVMLH